MGFAQILVAPSTPLESQVRVETTTGALVMFAKAEHEGREVGYTHHIRSNANVIVCGGVGHAFL